jgi:hypothetical protein
VTRRVVHRYLDPVDEIWLATAQALGLRVRRSDDAYASYDGEGTLTITTSAHFDADDCLAQIIFHELCHALISGSGAISTPDWGLCNEGERDLVREHACHRLQAALADRHGLRGLLAVTTDHRAYWDTLPADPLAAGDDPAIALARDAWPRARGGAWGDAIEAALAATAQVARAVRPFAGDRSLWRATEPLHASGFRLHRDAELRCAQCAWLHVAGPGKRLPRCRQARDGSASIARRVEPGMQACERFEAKPEGDACATCGACCREGFDLVPVRAREPFARSHPSLVCSDAHGLHVPRPQGRCVALEGEGEARAPYRCRFYDERPRSCAQFEVFGDACLEARRRVGLSR